MQIANSNAIWLLQIVTVERAVQNYLVQTRFLKLGVRS